MIESTRYNYIEYQGRYESVLIAAEVLLYLYLHYTSVLLLYSKKIERKGLAFLLIFSRPKFQSMI